eukprot:6171824-Pleurochrysis_carterae.AAC.2
MRVRPLGNSSRQQDRCALHVVYRLCIFDEPIGMCSAHSGKEGNACCVRGGAMGAELQKSSICCYACLVQVTLRIA